MPFFLVGHLAGDGRKDKPDGELIFAGTPIYNERASQKPDSFEKSQVTARKPQRREAYLSTPQRLRGATQHGNWVFYGTVSRRGF
jgi:hypothetical protein